MASKISRLRLILAGSAAVAALAACNPNGFDLDMRGYGKGGLDTSAAAQRAVQDRPRPDAQGIITYPNYQVVVARRGDTPNAIAQRIGADPGALARYNAIAPNTVLGAGEILALPNKVATTGSVAGTGTNPSALTSETIDITSLASNAIDKAQTNQPKTAAATPSAATTTAPEPIRHKVARGETAYSIARYYSVPVKALAEWNGLPNDLSVREGQVLIIPVAANRQPPRVETATATTAPGTGSPTPVPPSASEPLPAKTPPKASTPVPDSAPDLGSQRTKASDSAKMTMPVSGSIIRQYTKARGGIDISAAPGAPVKAAESGSVLLISDDTDGNTFLALKHADGLVTVYYNISGISVKKGASVKRGQSIAKVASGDPGYLHFEVRKGIESVDPMPYLN